MKPLACALFLIIASLISGCSNNENPVSEKSVEVSAAELLYQKNCKVCHAQGINGAPILGNQKMWSGRAEQGLETLVKHAIEGYGLMPAKGGRAELSDADIEQIVSYMLSALPAQ